MNEFKDPFITQLELCRGRARHDDSHLIPGIDWPRFTEKVLLDPPTPERLLGLGTFTGQLIVNETGSYDDQIVREIAERFVEAAKPPIKGENRDHFDSGIAMALILEKARGRRRKLQGKIT